MKRRDFITLLGGAAAAWPLAARAQQSGGMRRIGVLHSTAADDPQDPTRLAAFTQSLQEVGWTIGRTLRLDHRWAAGDSNDARKYAVELAALSPDNTRERLFGSRCCATDNSPCPDRFCQHC